VEAPINTTYQNPKAMRGTKRVCQACEVRFYDLSRDPIICPSCGAHYLIVALPTAEVGARTARFSNKAGWRNRAFERADTQPKDAPEHGAAGASATEDATLGPAPNDDVVLDEEPDEAADKADVLGLVDHGGAEPEER
jgi:uncharacterized protein (TIGR02300 family)